MGIVINLKITTILQFKKVNVKFIIFSEAQICQNKFVMMTILIKLY